MTQRPLVPRFLKKLDEYLLIHKPSTWSTRAHLAIWYSLLFAAVLTFICFIVPFDARESSNVTSWVLLVSVIIIISFVVWLIYLLRFNVFKKFGHVPPLYGTQTFVFYFIIISSFIIWGYIPGVVESIRANKAYTSDEIVRDINTINLDLCRLERDSIQLEWKKDTSILRKDTRGVGAVDSSGPVVDEDALAQVDPAEPVVYHSPGNESNITWYTYKDVSFLKRRVKTADSVIHTNDSTWVFYECPSYHFLEDHDATYYSRIKLLSSAEIFDKVLRNYRPPNRAAVAKELDSVVLKYRPYDPEDWYMYPRDYRFYRPDYLNHTQSKYHLQIASRSVDNITGKKYRWEHDVLKDYVHPFYYIVLVLTLLIFIFRHTTIKTFFLTLLSAVILLILTSLVFAFMHYDNEQSTLGVMLAYFLVFTAVAISIGMDRVRRAWKGISLNLFVFCLPFIPMIVVALYYRYLRDTYSIYQYPGKFTHEHLHILLGEIAGFVILFALLDIMIRPLYRKWYAQPEQ